MIVTLQSGTRKNQAHNRKPAGSHAHLLRVKWIKIIQKTQFLMPSKEVLLKVSTIILDR